MARVKEALIGWSAARTPSTSALIPPGLNARPGDLPCPDTDNTGTDSGACVAGAVGRVPWRSLGIPEPKDGAGETLWYAIAGPFRNFNMSAAPITSDTLGDLTVYIGSSSSPAIAIIFSPGGALDTQDRNAATTALCTTTGTTIARNLCATNYLEATGGGNNAQTAGPFIQAPTSSTFNDRVLAITTADLMPAVERRVAREIISILQQYKVATSLSTLASLLPGFGVYPWADRSDGGANTGWNHNRFPCGSALPVAWGAVPTGGTQATPTLPNWLTNGCDCTAAGQRGWACVILYAVAKNKLENLGLVCNEVCAADTLTITNPSSRTADVCLAGVTPFVCTPAVVGTISADLVLITPGSTQVNRALPIGVAWPNTAFTTITLYFEDLQNGANNSDTYAVPISTNYDRDRIYIVR